MAEYYRPDRLSEALELRAQKPLTIMAGGTDIYPPQVTASSWGPKISPPILDITAIAVLRGIQRTDEGWSLGACTSWSDLITTELPPLFDGYKAAAREVGGVQIQNRATLAGNICTASPAGDGVPNLFALNAKVELSSLSGTRTVPIDEFIVGYRRTALRSDEIVTAIHVPDREDQTRSAFVKLGARKYLVISIVMAAGVVTFKEGLATSASIVLGSCSETPQRQSHLESWIVGKSADQIDERLSKDLEIQGLEPISDIRATRAYRQHAARIAVSDLLGTLLGNQIKEAA